MTATLLDSHRQQERKAVTASVLQTNGGLSGISRKGVCLRLRQSFNIPYVLNLGFGDANYIISFSFFLSFFKRNNEIEFVRHCKRHFFENVGHLKLGP